MSVTCSARGGGPQKSCHLFDSSVLQTRGLGGRELPRTPYPVSCPGMPRAGGHALAAPLGTAARDRQVLPTRRTWQSRAVPTTAGSLLQLQPRFRQRPGTSPRQLRTEGLSASLAGLDSEEHPGRPCGHPGSPQTPTGASGRAPSPLPACAFPPRALCSIAQRQACCVTGRLKHTVCCWARCRIFFRGKEKRGNKGE